MDGASVPDVAGADDEEPEMSMSTPSPQHEPEQADLVAYLDGELQGEAARRVEAQLAHDGKARAEADSLKRTCGSASNLICPDRYDPSASFTHRTLDGIDPIRAARSKTGTTCTGWVRCNLTGQPRRLLFEAEVSG